jgi:dephospho-CoA kinase
MLKIGITGNIYSEHQEIAKQFYNIGVPLFDADVVIKFILNYRQDYINLIRKKIGNHIFYHNYLEPSKISYYDFNIILDLIKGEIFNSYEKWRLKYKNNYYTIFLCSVLFEKEWNEHMNFNINVYKPESMRISNYKKNHYYFNQSLFNNEMPDADKNVIANWVIHNYPTSHDTVLTQIKKINNNIISRLDNRGDDVIFNLKEII